MARVERPLFRKQRPPSTADFGFERVAWRDGLVQVAGVDEAGRGPLAGPVVAAAVVWPVDFRAGWLKHVGDSKTLRPDQREFLFPRIQAGVRSYAVGIVDAARIDSVNILNATKEAMLMAVEGLDPCPQLVLIDAVTLPSLKTPQKGIVRGDAQSYSIAAASIIAKVTRDRLMTEMAEAHPGYGFERHFGYPTRAHREALMRLGPCLMHRQSFEPVRRARAGGIVAEQQA